MRRLRGSGGVFRLPGGPARRERGPQAGRLNGWRVALCVGCLAGATTTARGQVGPTTTPATRPSAMVDITPADGPTAVPFVLSGTDHVIVRAKINGHGPYNFVMDTGAPTLLVDEKVGQEIGLAADPTTRPATRPSARHWSTIDTLDLEGGLSMSKVKCLVLTPYQLTGMNAIGMAGVELHGLMGYSVLARFKIELDLTRHVMHWTPQHDYTPPPLQLGGGGTNASPDDVDAELRLESIGSVMRVLGPLVKASMPPPARPRGTVGLVLAGSTVTVDKVLAGGPAERAGVKAGDELVSVDGHKVRTAADAEAATAHTLPGDTIRVTVRRGPTTRAVTVTAGEGL